MGTALGGGSKHLGGTFLIEEDTNIHSHIMEDFGVVY